VSDGAVTEMRSATMSSAPGADILDYLALLKPRVMSLVVFTGLVGMLLSPAGIHPILAAASLFCIAVGAGASGAINMWFDRDIDKKMERTRERPIPAGLVTPGTALGIGVWLSFGSVTLMGLVANWVAAALLAFTIFFYVFVYTIWLKRRTPQNIVIGGAAGALPPVVGWAAATGDVGVVPLILFTIIFFWTPPHFWALAITRASEYKAANVPMLPVIAGDKTTRRHIFLYSLLLVAVSFGPVWVGFSGILYGVAAAALGLVFIVLAFLVLVSVSFTSCRRLFGYSILYLFLLFLTLGADHMLGNLSLRAI
jgi:protoheme IX farnesyltransferase